MLKCFVLGIEGHCMYLSGNINRAVHVFSLGDERKCAI